MREIEVTAPFDHRRISGPEFRNADTWFGLRIENRPLLWSCQATGGFNCGANKQPQQHGEMGCSSIPAYSIQWLSTLQDKANRPACQ